MDAAQATRLAEQGIGTCRTCKRNFPIRELISLWFGGAPLLAVCPACADGPDEIVIRRVPSGIEIAMRSRRDAALVVGIRGNGLVEHVAGPIVTKQDLGED